MAHTAFVLEALEQGLHDRRPAHRGGLVHHSNRPSHGLKVIRCRVTGRKCLSIKYSKRLVEAGIEPSVGNGDNSYDNAVAESVNALYQAEFIQRRGPWRNL